MNILYIETAGDKAKIGLITENKTNFISFGPKQEFSEKLLAYIEKLIKNNKTSTQNLDTVAVFRGPGSFTGLRIGIATANALGFSLNIPIIEISETDLKKLPESIIKKFRTKKFKRIIVPFYGKTPHITKPKNHEI